jgi:hypothetical protein
MVNELIGYVITFVFALAVVLFVTGITLIDATRQNVPEQKRYRWAGIVGATSTAGFLLPYFDAGLAESIDAAVFGRGSDPAVVQPPSAFAPSVLFFGIVTSLGMFAVYLFISRTPPVTKSR